VKRRKANKEKLVHAFHTSIAFMDYLYGDVKPDEYVACYYEYARESESVWQAARERDERIKKGQSSTSAALCAFDALCRANFQLPPIRDFLLCKSFPKKDWNELRDDERREIMRFLPKSEVRSLPMDDLVTLQAVGILDKFKDLAEQSKPAIAEVPLGQVPEPMKLVEPMLQQMGAVYQAIFALDFSKSEKQLVEEFRVWLRISDHAALLTKHKIPKTGKTGWPRDRLKDLAAWRLFRELNNDWQAANDFANKHRRQRKAFRDAKSTADTPANEADLFGEEADAYKAKASALKYLADLMPNEFGQPDLAEAFAGLDKIAREG
jgi:hypothetical protein